jgi:hypothetical protein
VYDEAPVIPSRPLVVPSATLLLLASVERTIVVMIAVPEVILSLLITETATALIPSKDVPAILVVREVPAVVLLTRWPIPVRVHRSRLVGSPAIVVLHTAAVLWVQRLLDWGWRGYVVR